MNGIIITSIICATFTKKMLHIGKKIVANSGVNDVMKIFQAVRIVSTDLKNTTVKIKKVKNNDRRKIKRNAF